MTASGPERVRGMSVWFAVPALVFVDLSAKVWARSLGEETSLGATNAFLGFRLIENRGVSFSALDFGSGAGQVTLLVLTVGLVVAIGAWMVRARNEWQRLFLGMIFAGGLSNVIDRLLNGAVTDFIEYRWFGRTLFIGNLADFWIFVGVVGAFAPLLLVRRSLPAARETESSK